MPKLTIDDIAIEVEEGVSIMQACERIGIEIPRFCLHKKLSIAGSCRMCLVEVEKSPKPVASCTQPCMEGMIVRTDTPAIHKARKDVMELLLINHPLDCAICDQGGECDLQDQSYFYGSDKGRYSEARRIVRDKDLGPLIKTNMTRCIHCTRCIRFADEIAGEPELGGLFRGEHMEIDKSSYGALRSELSGNLIDVCPVGALTNKPYAFRARSWELKKTPSIDVMDAVGCNIRIDTRDNEVMRILPRANEDINEEWINDKTRFACDGLKINRLDQPYVRKDGELRPASWDEAISIIAERLKNAAPERIAAIAGDQVDCESMFAMKSLVQSLGSPNMDCRQDGVDYDISARSYYIMNSGISGIEKADAILLIGTNPRIEATLVNARIRKRWCKSGVSIGMIGAETELGYPFAHLGTSPAVINDLIEGKNEFGNILKNAKYPVVILGAGALARVDGRVIHAQVCELAEKFNMIRSDWNGFNLLQLVASRVGGLDIGFVPQEKGLATHGILGCTAVGKMDMLFLLGADEIESSRLGKTFVVYQGHHGDNGARCASVILPSSAYTEKSVIYVNTEGRPQMTEKAVSPPKGACEDWKIIRTISEAAGKSIPYETKDQLRACMTNLFPHMGNIGNITNNDWKKPQVIGIVMPQRFSPAIPNFYMTDPISRASPTMAKCTAEILPLILEDKING